MATGKILKGKEMCGVGRCSVKEKMKQDFMNSGTSAEPQGEGGVRHKPAQKETI